MLKHFLLIATILSLTACGQTNSTNKSINTTDNSPILTKTEKMDTVHFWKIMDYGFEKGKFDNKIKEQAILQQLIRLTPEQIQQFEIIFQQMNKKSSTQANLAAQTIIEGGSSDDRFYYFRCWIISLGQNNFNEVLKNPDYLATLDIPINKQYGMMYCQFEELIPMADRAYEVVTKKDPSTDTTFPRSHADKLGVFYDSGTEITGTEWEYDDLPKILPLLNKKYPNQ
ncbi:MAG: DUF4240 domain-containing protein [Ferruginibacter sp.]|nr:DUF4240 domain-containing protein [Ferruginibacter sp.]